MDAPTSSLQQSQRRAGGRPLVIGVTGHRDLVADEVAGIEAAVRSAFARLAERFPERPLQVLSPLAEGADRLVARVAEDLDIDLCVPMPMPEHLYAKDFESSRSWAEFGRLTRYARDVVVLPMAPGNTREAIADYGAARDRQYAEAGAWVAAHADVLIAIWDGRTTGDLGGTGQVVQFRLEGRMPDYMPAFAERPLQDLVLHIVCSRDRMDGDPATGLRPLSVRWLDARGQATPELPKQAEMRLGADVRSDADRARGSVFDHSWRLPLVIGVTGHRDLRTDELPEIRERVRTLFVDLMARYPTRKLQLLSPLAEGADRLVAEVALSLDIGIRVVLPMPRALYYTRLFFCGVGHRIQCIVPARGRCAHPAASPLTATPDHAANSGARHAIGSTR